VIILVIVIALCIYHAIRNIRSRRTVSTEYRQPSIDPTPGTATAAERWGPIDDMQLTRLLRHAAHGD
jgi:hypothetical protein